MSNRYPGSARGNRFGIEASGTLIVFIDELHMMVGAGGGGEGGGAMDSGKIEQCCTPSRRYPAGTGR